MTRTKLLSFCGFLALIACGAQAQKVNVFGGCQCLRLDSGPSRDRNSSSHTNRSACSCIIRAVRLVAATSAQQDLRMVVGGRADVGHRPMAWRMAQAGWLIMRFSGFTDKKNERVSTGLGGQF